MAVCHAPVSQCRERGERATDLVGVLECPTVHAVVGRVQVTLREPSDVAVLEAAGADGVERAVPVEGLPGHLEHDIRMSLRRSVSKLRLTLAHHLSAAGPTVSAWTFW